MSAIGLITRGFVGTLNVDRYILEVIEVELTTDIIQVDVTVENDIIVSVKIESGG